MQKLNNNQVKLPFLSYFRVRYADTDKMGVVYYGRYYEFFEVGRTEWIRHYWKPYSEVERNGFLLPVVFSACVYNQSFYYDEIIKIQCFPIGFTNTRVRFGYYLTEGQSVSIRVNGVTEHTFVNSLSKIQRIPNELRTLLIDHVPMHLSKFQTIFT